MLSIPDEEVLTRHIQALQALADWHRQAAATIDTHKDTLFDHLQRWDRNHANNHHQWSTSLRDRHLQQADTFEQTIQWLQTSFAAQYAVDRAKVIS